MNNFKKSKIYLSKMNFKEFLANLPKKKSSYENV